MLWENETRKGDTYFSGYYGEPEAEKEDQQKIVVFQNNSKDRDAHPDYIIYLSQPMEEREEEEEEDDEDEEEDDEDEVPF